MSDFKLTPQQEAVVAHEQGPALVFAVAGAGKTTSILYRVERLVRENVFPARKILTTSFGVSNVRDMKEGLAGWPACGRVDVRTLHSLGWEIIRTAGRMGLTELSLKRDTGSIDDLTRQLFFRTLGVARQQQVDFVEELDGIDREDFLDYVASCKGNLMYADLNAAELPEAGGAAVQAKPPAHLSWYLDLYRIFEKVRLHANAITFDDMVMTGWELLIRNPELLAAMQKRYDAVIVDEFQDVNLAQAAVLDLLTEPHRNLMVVGDDDQTIYEWRGASTHFILNFAEKYGAAEYVIDENFRCPAGPLVLANRVIHHNRRRQVKRLQLTRGFDGHTVVRGSADPLQMGHDIAAEIGRLVKTGTELSDIAVLVRLNGQTPPLEQALIHRDLPYRIKQPFYERPEISTLVHYLRLAWVEEQMRRDRPVTATMGQTIARGWRQIANRPKRYINREILDEVDKRLRRLEERPSLVLHRVAGKIHQEWRQTHLLELADHLNWLSQQLDKRAYRTLNTLVGRLDYLRFLRENSGFVETGEGRAVGVEAFLNYARSQGKTMELMGILKQLAKERAEDLRENRPALTVSTIHQAKGLEWPVVIIGQCNDGLMPFQGLLTENPEEERRLMYVALTRAARDLYVYYTEDQPPSPYLAESGWDVIRPPLRFVEEQLGRPVAEWDHAQVVQFLNHISELRVGGYFFDWWRPENGEFEALRGHVRTILEKDPKAFNGCTPEVLARFRT